MDQIVIRKNRIEKAEYETVSLVGPSGVLERYEH